MEGPDQRRCVEREGKRQETSEYELEGWVAEEEPTKGMEERGRATSWKPGQEPGFQPLGRQRGRRRWRLRRPPWMWQLASYRHLVWHQQGPLLGSGKPRWRPTIYEAFAEFPPGGDGNRTGEEGAGASEGNGCRNPGRPGAAGLCLERPRGRCAERHALVSQTSPFVRSHNVTRNRTFPGRFQAGSR